MTDLAARVQAGPASRELADEVLVAWGWKKKSWGSEGGWWANDWIMPTGDYFNADNFARPNPLRSVDAAMAGVPEGWGFDLFVDTDGKSVAAVYSNDKGSGVTGSSPAQALTAACLRAMAEKEGGNG